MTDQWKKQEANNRRDPNTEQSEVPRAYVPRFLDLGSVESMTHGSRENTSDEPDSGYKGG